MKIRISDYNYHIANLSLKEKEFVKGVSASLFNKYPSLKQSIFKQIKNAKIQYVDDFLESMLTAFLYSFKDNKFDENKLLKELKTCLNVFLPIILENAKSFTCTSFLFYEPKVALMYNFANYITRTYTSELDKLIENNQLSDFEQYQLLDFVALCRCIKSSMVMFALGDDVHGISLFRGAVELSSTIGLSTKFQEDYVKYKNYNASLQYYKLNNEPLPKEMVDDLGDKSKNEDFIKYGWAKNKNGKRITRMFDFIKIANPNDVEKLEQFLHYSSEFIHEDYSGVEYNFVLLRKEFIFSYYKICASLLNSEIITNEKINKKYVNLFSFFK